MSTNRELFNPAGAESEGQTLFDELAGLVPAERQAEYSGSSHAHAHSAQSTNCSGYWKQWAFSRL